MSLPSQQILRTPAASVPLYHTGGHRIQDTDPFVSAAHKALGLAPSPYSTLFFGQMNMDTLQRAVRKRIHAQYGFTIDRQNDDDLSVIMRAVFTSWRDQPASDAPDDVRCAVAALNSVVMKIIYPQVASGVTGFVRYMKDASHLPAPLPMPKATSTAGTKNLPIFSGV